jgi:hypothetical protein
VVSADTSSVVRDRKIELMSTTPETRYASGLVIGVTPQTLRAGTGNPQRTRWRAQ